MSLWKPDPNTESEWWIVIRAWIFLLAVIAIASILLGMLLNEGRLPHEQWEHNHRAIEAQHEKNLRLINSVQGYDAALGGTELEHE